MQHAARSGQPVRRPKNDSAVVAALLASVTDPDVRALLPGVGSVEQWVDNVDVLAHPERRHAVVAAYRRWSG